MRKILLFITITLMATCFQLNAQTIVFDGGTDSDWNKPENWVGGILPGAGNDVNLDGKTVVLSASTTVQRVFANSTSNLTINSGITLTVTGFAGSDDGLELANSAIVVNNGTIAISNIHVADTNADGIYNRGTITNNGAITIDGTGQYGIYMQRGTFTNSATGTLTIANYGQGDTAADGLYLDHSSGNISTFHNFGSVDITMPGSDDGLYVINNSIFNNDGMLTVGGAAGDNAIRIDNSGVFNNNSGGTFTINSTPDDQLFLDDDGAFNNTGTVNLNNAADVGLYVTDQGLFTNNSGGNVNITSATNFSIQVDANSLTANISNTGTITITGGSTDAVRLQESGSFTNNAGGSLIINQPPTEGIRLDATAGTFTNSGTITITGSGSGVAPGDNGIEISGGTLTNSIGATLTITNIFDKGILTTGGIINNTGTIDISNTGEEGMDMNTGGTFNNNNGGVLKVVDGAADALEINTGCTVINDGDMQLTFTTDGSGRDDIEFNGGTFTNNSNATFNPGNAGTYGEVEFHGIIDLGMSTTTFDISGTTHTTEFDRIAFADTGSSLTFTNAKAHLNWGSYVPNVGDTFKIIDGSAGTVIGAFSSVTTSNSDIVTTINYSANEVQVEVTDINSTWTGNTDTVWNDASNWSTIVPTATTDVTIPSGLSNYPTAAIAVSTSSITMEAGSSFIANSTVAGNVTYNRTLTSKVANADGWHLISSPVDGQVYNNAYATTNGLATSGTKRGLAFYNDALASGSKYTYLLSDDTNAASFNSGTYSGSGIGYSAKIASTGTIAFTGTINTADVNGVSVSASDSDFVLLGVPYTSYISSQTFLNDNTNLDQSQIWIWEQGTTGGNFIASTAKGDNFILAPGQGFFVKKAATGATVDFAESNQQANADTFKKSSRTEIKLLMNDGNSNRFAKFYYVDNVTKGYDEGWEGETFGGIKNSLDIYSQLVEGNEGKNYQVQSLPVLEMESIIIPIGLTAVSGKEITFSAEGLNLPSGIKVILEDRLKSTFTRLDEVNSEYKITLTEASNGVGRFYLYTTQSALSVADDAFLDNLSVYKLNNNTLRIAGLKQGKANIKLFTILGKQAINTSFESNGVKDISLPKLATGIYIVQLETEAGKLSKKIILE